MKENKWLKLVEEMRGGNIPKMQNGEETILNANKEVDEWNKEYVQSSNYRNLLNKAGLNDREIEDRINAVLNFNVNSDITFDETNPSMGSMYNTATTTSGGWNMPMTTFPGEGVDMINYNPSLMTNHPAYDNEGIAVGGWPAVSAHEQGHLLGPGGLNRSTTKTLKGIAKDNKRYLKSFAGGNKKTYRHAKDPDEMRANLLQLRYQMGNSGLYNSSEETPFTQEDLMKIADFDENGTFIQYKPEFNNELLQTIPPEDVIWMMNNIAQNQEIGDNLPDGMMRAQQGGSLPQFQNGEEPIYGGMLPEVGVSALTDKTYNTLSDPQKQVYSTFVNPNGDISQTVDIGDYSRTWSTKDEGNRLMHWKGALQMTEDLGIKNIHNTPYEAPGWFFGLNEGSTNYPIDKDGNFRPHAMSKIKDIHIPAYNTKNSRHGWMNNHIKNKREDLLDPTGPGGGGVGMWDFENMLDETDLTPEQQEYIKQQYISSPTAEKDLELYEKTFRDNRGPGEGRQFYFDNLIAEYAHIPEYHRTNTWWNRPITNLKRAYRGIKEGKWPDTSNYKDPHDIEHMTHTGPDSFEEKLRSKYEIKKFGGSLPKFQGTKNSEVSNIEGVTVGEDGRLVMSQNSDIKDAIIDDSYTEGYKKRWANEVANNISGGYNLTNRGYKSDLSNVTELRREGLLNTEEYFGMPSEYGIEDSYFGDRGGYKYMGGVGGVSYLGDRFMIDSETGQVPEYLSDRYNPAKHNSRLYYGQNIRPNNKLNNLKRSLFGNNNHNQKEFDQVREHELGHAFTNNQTLITPYAAQLLTKAKTLDEDRSDVSFKDWKKMNNLGKRGFGQWGSDLLKHMDLKGGDSRIEQYNKWQDTETGDYLTDPAEVWTRYKKGQKHLKDAGIFDHTTGQSFTEDDYNKVKEWMLTDDFKNADSDVREFFGTNDWTSEFNKEIEKDDMIEIMNNVADTNTGMPLGMSKYGGSLPKAQDGLNEFCANAPIIDSGGKVFAQCENREYDSEHIGELGATMSVGKLNDDFTSSFGLSGGYTFNPSGGTGGLKTYIGGNYGLRATENSSIEDGLNGTNVDMNTYMKGLASLGYTGEVGGNSYNWQTPTQYELGAYADKDLIGNNGTTFGGYGRFGPINIKAGYNPKTGSEFSAGFGLPIREKGGSIKHTIKRGDSGKSLFEQYGVKGSDILKHNDIKYFKEGSEVEIPKYQDVGEFNIDLTSQADNTYVQQPQFNIPIAEEEQYVDQFGSPHGSHFPSGPEPTLWNKIVNAAANPLGTFGYSVRGQDIPWGNVPRHGNPLDTFALGMINPASWWESGEAAVGEFKQGNILAGSLEALGAIPTIPAGIGATRKLLPDVIIKPILSGAKSIKSFISPKFVSEIDWSKWNKAIPENKELLDEYHLIEQTAKKNKTWMKNLDGSDFLGSPEQFVQVNSNNFKLAYPEGFTSVYRGFDETGGMSGGSQLRSSNPFGKGKPKNDRRQYYTGMFTGDEVVANSYRSNDGTLLNLAMKNSDNSLKLEGLGNWHNDLTTIGSSKQILKKNIDNLKKQIKKSPGEGYNYNSASSAQARLESYENFYNNYDEIVSNPIYKKLVKYKEDLLKVREEYHTPNYSLFSTDDLAQFLEKEGLDNIQLKYLDDNIIGTVNISNQVEGNYLKSLDGSDGMFDLTNKDIYKKYGGRIK